MASTENGKRRSAGRRRGKAQRRSSPAKQRRRQGQRKPRHAAGMGSGKGSPRPRNANGPRAAERRLSTKATDLMIGFVNDIYEQVSAAARRRRSRGGSVGPSPARAALPSAGPEPRPTQPPAPVAEASQ